MARPSSIGGRNLTLTEELERLEQSITLTLQEIDHNFSKAHRIVTSSILPVVEQYATHSKDVWEGSKFWKQFFEASANVSLSGYEEAPLEDDVTQTDTATHDSTFETPSGHEQEYQGEGDEQDSTIHGVEEQYAGDEEESSIMESPSNATGVHSTPRIGQSAASRGKGRRIVSPSPPPKSSSVRTLAFRSPHPQASADVSTPVRSAYTYDDDSSPFEPPSAFQPSTAQRQNPDPLMHRVLDRTFRVQATPHEVRKQYRAPPSETTATRTKSFLPDSSPMSSPEMAAPQLRSDLFSPAAVRQTPRTPGVSVQTPARGITTSTGRSLFTGGDTRDVTRTLWGSDDSDDDTGLGISPPKTMQFHVPQSRLLHTPAREASRKIVEDLLLTAGADRTDEIEEDGEEISPSVVRRKWDDDDDTF